MARETATDVVLDELLTLFDKADGCNVARGQRDAAKKMANDLMESLFKNHELFIDELCNGDRKVSSITPVLVLNACLHSIYANAHSNGETESFIALTKICTGMADNALEVCRNRVECSQ